MPHFRRPPPYAIALLCCSVLVICRIMGLFTAAPQNSAVEHRVVTVAYVYDGDTIETSQGERVRLLGIDAPEVAHHDVAAEFFGEESTSWLRRRIGQQAVLLKPGPEPTDRYGRTLAWVFDRDGRFVNQELLRTGNAVLLDHFGLPAEYEPQLRAAESAAKSEKRGVWQ